MKFLIYIGIFISKVVENALSTLRLIVVAKGKRKFGAILQFIIAFVWVITTGIVVTNIKNDPLKIVFFSFGSLIGSYIGSFVEEKISLGNDMIFIMTNKNQVKKIENALIKNNYLFYEFFPNNNQNFEILLIIEEKTERKNIIKIIHNIDDKAFIKIESIKLIKN